VKNHNKRTIFALALLTIFCALGAAIASMTFYFFVVPEIDAAADRRAESAYVRGAMVAISAAPTRCQQWQLRARRAVCDD
jgi:type IV pilus biogenesis protein CpaD/CtpE